MTPHRFPIVRRLDELEIALVRASLLSPGLLAPPDETALRTAISLARLQRVGAAGSQRDVDRWTAPLREQVTRRLEPVLLGGQPPSADTLLPHVAPLRDEAKRTRALLGDELGDAVDPGVIDREIREKSLVLVLGGGGGTGFVYLGAMALLDELGLRPGLIAGTSMGAVLGLFRSRLPRFEASAMLQIIRSLTWRRLFRAISSESRFGLPAAFRLHMRATLGRYFQRGEETYGEPMTLGELPIPTLVQVSGLRPGMLPRPLQFYSRLVALSPRALLDPLTVVRKVHEAMGALAELFTRSEAMERLVMGADPLTRGLPALDAVGFSSALPGVIHYDVSADDTRTSERLQTLFEERRLLRMIDGGLTDNLPARAAWQEVDRGRIGSRNAFILGLNAFSPKLSTPLWLPLERLAALTVTPNRPYAHLVVDFRRTLSPLEIVPSIALAARALDLGRDQLSPEVPFLCRMLAPLAPLW